MGKIMTPFKKNARVTFLGDSITATNNYTARIADHYRRFLPELKVSFACAGVSGGSATSGLLYLEPDLYPTKPDVVTIMLGVNDSNRDFLSFPDSPERRENLDAALNTYKTKMNLLVDTLIARGIEVILCTPAPYAEFFTTDQTPLQGGHALILRYAEAVREMAKERGLELVDFHTRLSEIYLDEPLYKPDHVHPNDAGHARMAECFLAAQGIEVRKWRAGEAPEPISPELDEWRALNEKVRRIYACEWMLVRNYGLSLEEKLAFMRDYAANEKQTIPYFKAISVEYLKDKPHETEMVARINEIMEQLYD